MTPTVHFDSLFASYSTPLDVGEHIASIVPSRWHMAPERCEVASLLVECAWRLRCVACSGAALGASRLLLLLFFFPAGALLPTTYN